MTSSDAPARVIPIQYQESQNDRSITEAQIKQEYQKAIGSREVEFIWVSSYTVYLIIKGGC